MTKEITAKQTNIKKELCLCLLAGAFIYGLILPFCWHNNPTQPLGTLSVLCEDHKPYFWVWALLTAGAYSANIKFMQTKFLYKNKFADVLMILAIVGMILVSATLKHDVTTVNTRRVIHWVGAIAFALFTGLSMFVFFVSQIKKDKRFIAVGGICAAILLLMLFWITVIGKSGLMEIIPNAMLQIFVAVINFTNVLPVTYN